LLIFLLASLVSAQTHVQLVLDASGSMWNKLSDGEYRIVAAKDVLSSFVSSLPADPDLNVGLRVYGSQVAALEEGACEDSQLFVPMSGIARDDLLTTVRNTQATGATPIAYSLQLAGQDFPEEGKKVIILVTDGEESCGGDVRGTIEALKAQGNDFDLKIIGFDLDDRAIQSFEGLGTFENAKNAQELASALGRAVEVEKTQTYPVTVLVTREGSPATDGATTSFVDAVTKESFDFTLTEVGRLTAELPAGSYNASVQDAFSDSPQSFNGLNVTPESDNSFSFELAAAVDVVLSVSPTEATVGSSVTVDFENAPVNGLNNYITIVPVDADDRIYFKYQYIDAVSGQVDIQVPDEAQTLEARYHLDLPEGGTKVIGRSEPFTTVAASATLSAVGEVAAGANFDVTWTGPNNERDYVTVVPAGSPEGAYKTYFYTKNVEAIGQLTASIEPGDYEIRYVTGQSQATLASIPLTVTGVTASVEAPAEVAAGATFTASWTGPDNERDYLTIVPLGAAEGIYKDYFYTTEGNSGELIAGIEPGDYEVRYVTGQGGKTLASTIIKVTAISASLNAPTEAMAGSRITVTWTGPDNEGDYVTIVASDASEGSYKDYYYTKQGASGEIQLQAEPGNYEVRYVNGQGGSTLVSVPLTLTAMQITLEAAAEVSAGENFEVAWTGPEGERDYLTIVPVGAEVGAYLSYQYVKNANPVTLRAPEEAGSYEIRYQTDADGVFASIPITVK